MTTTDTTATRHDVRYVDNDDPRAVMVAWINAAPMGGWTDTDEDAFRAAIADEVLFAAPGLDLDDLAPIDITRTTR